MYGVDGHLRGHLVVRQDADELCLFQIICKKSHRKRRAMPRPLRAACVAISALLVSNLPDTLIRSFFRSLRKRQVSSPTKIMQLCRARSDGCDGLPLRRINELITSYFGQELLAERRRRRNPQEPRRHDSCYTLNPRASRIPALPGNTRILDSVHGVLRTGVEHVDRSSSDPLVGGTAHPVRVRGRPSGRLRANHR